MFSSNRKFYLKSTISSVATAGSTFNISGDLETGEVIDTGGEIISIIWKNSTQIERFEVTITAGVATIIARGLDQTGTITEDVALQRKWAEGTIGYETALAFDLLDKQNTLPDRFTAPTVADDTARGVLYPAPTGGEECRNISAGGLKQAYNSVTAQWETFGISTPTPNGSEVVAGIFQQSTQALFDAGDDLGSTGAQNVPKNSQLKTQFDASVSLKPTTTTIEETDNLIIDNAGVDRKILKSDVRESLAGTTDIKGTWELATDLEAETGTSEELIINTKQAKDNYSNIPSYISSESLSTSGTATMTFTVPVEAEVIILMGSNTSSNFYLGQEVTLTRVGKNVGYFDGGSGDRDNTALLSGNNITVGGSTDPATRAITAYYYRNL